jgi:hypothetical protein
MSEFCSRFLKYTLIIIFGFLAFSSLLVTQSCFAAGEELANPPIYKLHDNILLHIAAILIFCGIIQLLRHALSHSIKLPLLWAKYKYVFRIFISLAMFLISFIMLLDGTRTPSGDQAQVYGAAMYFNEGNYINLSQGGYLDMYPHQLGYVAFLQLIFKLTGSNSFFMIQVINCLFIFAISLAVCMLLDDLTEQYSVQIVGSILLLFLFPLYFHASLLYGDIPSYLFTILFMHHFIKGLKRHSVPCFVLCIPEIILAMLFKKNSVIILIAAIVVLLVQIILTKRSSLIIMLLFLCLLPFVTSKPLENYYSSISGYDINGGIPSISWIAMGTLEGGCPGWFNNYPVPVYYETGCDREETAKEAVEKLNERFSYFKENPVYALSFWKRKISTQWNDPFFHSFDILFTDEETPAGLTGFIINHKEGMLVLLSLVQNIVYSGVLLYLIMRDTHKDMYQLLPEVCLLGEFLFSIIWEGNSRFILPYYIIMLPLSCIGWHALLSRHWRTSI